MQKEDKKSGSKFIERKFSCALCSYSAKTLRCYKQHLKVHSKEKPFKCPECPYRARFKANVKRHQQNVHLFKSNPYRPFPCSHSGCNYAAKQKSVLKTHSKIHLDGKLWVCSNCKYSTNDKGTLKLHIRIHTGENPFVCQFESCSYATAIQSNLVRHWRTHTKEKPYKCPQANCEYSAAHKISLRVHQLVHCENPKEVQERLSFQCPLCEFSTKYKNDLSQHIKNHTLEKLFKCDEPNCNFKARTNSEVKNHKLVHSDEKPFACSFESCEYRCKTRTNLSRHLKIHSEERQYKCELCPFRGKTRSNVISHIKNIHSDPDFRPFKCPEPQCGNATKTNPNLTRHLLIHKGEKKYSCSVPNCDYTAISESRIKKHFALVHEIGGEMKCGLCDYLTKSQGNLVRHMRIHTKETPYFCKGNGCTYKSKCSSALKQHHKLKHSQP